MKTLSEYFSCLYFVVVHYPEAEKHLIKPLCSPPSQSDIDFLYGFITGLHSAHSLTDDYYMSCLSELQIYERDMDQEKYEHDLEYRLDHPDFSGFYDWDEYPPEDDESSFF